MSASRRAIVGLSMAVGFVVAPVTTGIGAVSAGPGPAHTYLAAAPPATPDPASVASNPFIPDVNIGDCVSSLPRPDCGSDERGGYHQYVTLIILFLGTLFIAWRVARGVRARDRAAQPHDQSASGSWASPSPGTAPAESAPRD
jgi:hypothetical protein